jgi:hypothetical protein
MDKKIILGAAVLFVASLLILLLAPDDSVNSPDTLPWNIKHPTPDTVRVFGITLGQTTLGEAESTIKEQTEISLFKPNDKDMSVEAFVEEVNFNGLKAKIAMSVAVDPQQLPGMFQRGLRMNSTPSGKRITLTAADVEIVRNSPVASLTYLPTVRIEEAVLLKRFGSPAQRIQETQDDQPIHWLYPQHGLDIVLSSKGKPLLQYVALKNFDLLQAPLLKSGTVLK